MARAPEGTMWFGEYLIVEQTEALVADLFAAVDGSASDRGLVRRVQEFEAAVDGLVTFFGFDWTDPRQAPHGAPLGHLVAAPGIAVPERQTVHVRMVDRQASDDLEPAERMRQEFLGDAALDLLAIHWGEVVNWVPAQPVGGRAPVMNVQSGFLITLADPRRIVPSVQQAREWLREQRRGPGGERGQRLRELGHSWSKVPRAADWDEESAERWVLSGLLDQLAERANAEPFALIRSQLPVLTELVPGGGAVLAGRPWSPLIGASDDGLLTLWEGRGADGAMVAVAVHRSAGALTHLPMPLWPDQQPTSPPDGWCGEVMEYEDEPGEFSRFRFRITPVGRLQLPSQRIVASDPCVAGRQPALGITLPSVGPFSVHRTDLVWVTEEGGDLDEQARGILLVLDPHHSPTRWEPSTDDDGRPIECAIDTGLLLLGDATGAHVIQQGYDEGTIEYGAARLALLRSDPARPADLAILSDLGGDGPAWVVTGLAEDGHPVAVMVANFDPLS